MTYFKNTFGRLAALVIMTAAIAVLQYHSWDFWKDSLGVEMGILVSCSLEAGAIWFWSRRTWYYTTAGVIASVLVLSSGLYAMTGPTIKAYQDYENFQGQSGIRSTLLDERIASLENQLATFTTNSQTRVGWYGMIESTEAKLDEAYAARDSLITDESSLRVDSWQTVFELVGMAGVLIIFQVLVVATSRHAFRPDEPQTQSKPATKSKASTPPAKPNTTTPGTLKPESRPGTRKRADVIAIQRAAKTMRSMEVNRQKQKQIEYRNTSGVKPRGNNDNQLNLELSEPIMNHA